MSLLIRDEFNYLAITRVSTAVGSTKSRNDSEHQICHNYQLKLLSATAIEVAAVQETKLNNNSRLHVATVTTLSAWIAQEADDDGYSNL